MQTSSLGEPPTKRYNNQNPNSKGPFTMNYKNILLASDLSETSDQVIQRASEIAQENNATLNIIHVMEHSPVAYGGEFSIPIDPNLEQSLEANAREALAKVGEEFNIPSENQYVTPGTVKTDVIGLADKLNVDLIIVGSHGHHGIDVLLGSRANAILHAAKCDVLAIRVKE